MGIKLTFDNDGNAILPTLVLCTRSGHKQGALMEYDLVGENSFENGAEINFAINKCDCVLPGSPSWENIVDFKLIWVKEWNELFEMYVSLEESTETKKVVSAVSLGKAELSQINLYEIGINTEDDIDRPDYEPSVVYNPNNPKASIINRILDKAPHYDIGFVSSSLRNIQLSFTFDKKSIHDSLKEVCTELEAIAIVNCYFDSDYKIHRVVNIYDLKDYCIDCGERGVFGDTCSNCSGDNIIRGYGEDTTIFISTDNLAENITYQTDAESVKNCFRLVAGDDLMTATIANCNPNGSGYLWYFSDEIKKDMSEALRNKINDYNSVFDDIQKEREFSITEDLRLQYNALIEKYNTQDISFQEIPSSIIGYPAVMQTYYDTIDFGVYLSNRMMPKNTIVDTTAAVEASKINTKFNVIAVKDLQTASSSSVNNAIIAYIKTIIDNRYKAKVEEYSYEQSRWIGTISVTSLSNPDDTALTDVLQCNVTSDYDTFVKQMIDRTLAKNITDGNAYDIIDIFKLSDNDFKNEIKKYSLSRLRMLYDSCEACVNILVENGASDPDKIYGEDSSAYSELYLPYYSKLLNISNEINTREEELYIVYGKTDFDGEIVSPGVQNALMDIRTEIRDSLNFQDYIGDELWQELSAYRRDDEFSNQNYVSDGLDNAQIFKKALEFIDIANEEIYKSGNLQHSISATMDNLLAIKEFSPIVDYFETGNWIRVSVDNNLYRLRLIGFSLDFNDIKNISVTFSDVVKIRDGVSDVESIINQAESISTSYDYVARQAKKGNDSNDVLNNWVDNGLSLTKMKIIDDATDQNVTWGQNGILCREKLQDFDGYDEKQLKIINRGLYTTDDNWRTSKTGVGDFIYFDPKEGEYKEGYGVIADTLVGNLILSKEVGVYNESGSVNIDSGGLTITTNDKFDEEKKQVFTIQKITHKGDSDENSDEKTKLMYVDSDGNLVLHGSVMIESSNEDKTSLVNVIQTNREFVINTVRTEFDDSGLSDVITNITTNFTFNSDGQTIGKSDSPIQLHLTNDSVTIEDSGNAVTSMNNKGMLAQTITASDTLIIGDYVLQYNKADGHLSIF